MSNQAVVACKCYRTLNDPKHQYDMNDSMRIPIHEQNLLARGLRRRGQRKGNQSQSAKRLPNPSVTLVPKHVDADLCARAPCVCMVCACVSVMRLNVVSSSAALPTCWRFALLLPSASACVSRRLPGSPAVRPIVLGSDMKTCALVVLICDCPMQGPPRARWVEGHPRMFILLPMYDRFILVDCYLLQV
ncbi:hypothetical protein ACRALDRAFT_213626 [Sodiomyces alcalophilus JCM 7366]|uniref:uncharacterized protein n=1 Tax=Sodiomyces alcalophilus JCM 7366 TaxID=591952 RepID=UPI0039B6D437